MAITTRDQLLQRLYTDEVRNAINLINTYLSSLVLEHLDFNDDDEICIDLGCTLCSAEVTLLEHALTLAGYKLARVSAGRARFYI